MTSKPLFNFVLACNSILIKKCSEWRDIKDVLTDDKYQRGEISLERNIPAHWLGAEGDKQIEGLLLNPTGCVSLLAKLQAEFHPQANYQSMYVFLADYSDAESAKALAKKANSVSPKDLCCWRSQRTRSSAWLCSVRSWQTWKKLKQERVYSGLKHHFGQSSKEIDPYRPHGK